MAHFELGCMYEEDPSHQAEGRRLMQIAANSGHEGAQEKIRLYREAKQHAREQALALQREPHLRHFRDGGYRDEYIDTFRRFMRGRLVYKQGTRDEVTLPIAYLKNPLGGSFKLSDCGDAERYLSINTGYRTGKIENNKRKVEVWICPRFVIEKDIRGRDGHFREIMTSWNGRQAPIGLFFTMAHDDLAVYDYLTTKSPEELSSSNIYSNIEWYTPYRPFHRIHAHTRSPLNPNSVIFQYTIKFLLQFSLNFKKNQATG